MFDKLKTKWNELTNPAPLRPLTQQEQIFKTNQVIGVVGGVTNLGMSAFSIAMGIMQLKALNNSRKM